jgi:hypothetical protein
VPLFPVGTDARDTQEDKPERLGGIARGIGRKSNVLLPPAVLELVENDSAHNNATFNNLLPESRHIH